MTPAEGLETLPASGAHNCFGCSPANAHGLQMRFATDGEKLYSTVRIPPHLCGWRHLAHGGVLCTILDEIMSWAAIHRLRRITVTRRLQVEFVRPATVGTALSAEARLVGTAGEHDVTCEGVVRTAGGQVCASGRAELKVFSPAVARRLKIADEDTLKWFADTLGIR